MVVATALWVFLFLAVESSSGYSTILSPYQVHLAVTEDPSEMIVSWATVAPTATSIVLYGPKSDNFTYKAEGASKQYRSTWDLYTSPYLHEVLLTDLEPSTVYYYTVGDIDSDEWSMQLTFKTQPKEPKQEGIYIAAFGDHGFTSHSNLLTSRVGKLNPHLSLIAGDLAYANGDSPKWDEYMDYLSMMASSVPTMVAPGNHEAKSGENFIPYHERFAMPNNKFWYSVDYGTVHVIALSSEHNYTAGSSQYNWLVQDLENVSKNRTKTSWIFVMAHKPPYNSNANYGSFMEFRQVLQPLFERYSVDLAIFGHEHCYERTYPLLRDVARSNSMGSKDSPYQNISDATVWSVVGTGGKDLRNSWDPKPDWSAHREAENAGFAYIYVHGDEFLHWRYIRNDDKIPDEFYICKNPPCDFSKEPEFHLSSGSSIHYHFLLVLFLVFLFVL